MINDFDNFIYTKYEDGKIAKNLVDLDINLANEMSESEANDVISFLEKELYNFKNNRSSYFKVYHSALKIFT